MVDEAILALVHEFDRVFDCDDMVFPVLVGVVHHGRKRCGFARPGRTRYDDQPAMEHREFFQHGRQRRIKLFEVLERKHLAGNLAEDGGDAVFLIEEIGAEAGDVRYLIPEIDIARLLKNFDLVLGGDFIEHLLELVVLQGRVLHPVQFAINPQHRIVIRAEVQVRGLLLEHQIKESVDFRHNFVCSVRLIAKPGPECKKLNKVVEIISQEIAERGAITFARFMELALYSPRNGYYEREERSVGRHGDFYTSVSVGTLFCWPGSSPSGWGGLRSMV